MEPSPHVLTEPVSVLMPVCNEADIIRDVVEEWHREVFRHLPKGSELVFDDCSTDGTSEILHELSQGEYPYIRVNFSPKDGFFNSAMRLYRDARCNLIFFTDSDGQYTPADFWNVASQIANHDMVHGAKDGRHDPAFRLIASAVFNWIARLLFGTPGKDINSAFRLIRRPVIDAVLGSVRVMPTLLNAELYLRAEQAGFRIQNVPVRHRPRKFGVSRGLPLRRFGKECYGAYRGLMKLRSEFASKKSTVEPMLTVKTTPAAVDRRAA